MPSADPRDRLHRQFGRFLLTGGLVAASDFLCYLGLMSWGVSSLLANALGMTLGFLVGLYGHHVFSFRVQRRLGRRTLRRYGLTFAFNLALAAATLEVLLALELSPTIAKLLVMAEVVASNFLISRHFVFLRT